MKKSIHILICIILTGLSSIGYGQHYKKKSHYTGFEGFIGTSNYIGDLDPASNFLAPALKFTRLSLGASVMHRFGPHFSARGGLTWGRVKGSDREASAPTGDDAYRWLRNLSFRNDIIELEASLVYELFGNNRGFQRRVNYTPYVFAGIGVFYHNPKTKYNGEWVALRKVGTEGQAKDGVGVDGFYSSIQPSIPFGIGFKYKFSMVADISFEVGWRKTFTDYLDDVGGFYVDHHDFDDGSLAQALSDRSREGGIPFDVVESTPGPRVYTDDTGLQRIGGYGDAVSNRGDVSQRKDWYIFTGFRFTYIFHPRVVCPKFRG